MGCRGTDGGDNTFTDTGDNGFFCCTTDESLEIRTHRHTGTGFELDTILSHSVNRGAT